MIAYAKQVKEVVKMIKATCFNAYVFNSEKEAMEYALSSLFKILED